MSAMFEVLEKLQKHPGMYLGRTSARDLFIFLEGYRTARMDLGVELTEQEIEFLDEFQPWIQKRYNISVSASWAKIIELYTGSDERAFYEFFKLLNEFWHRHEQTEWSEIESPLETWKVG
ncbi:MAG: hypothetical protein HC780_28430 [Leptolyngbyaceae cyanobacterium CSU_1_3]|nr:hypothetical protein [Leptolyngbyaceae cyanobacterium CSU_1_3]